MTHRLHTIATFCAGLLSCFAETRPNIVLIMADDLGFSDIGAYGGEIETPALDSLAADGLKFANFYNSARCCPTRASLLTGLHPHQTGIGMMTSGALKPRKHRPAHEGYFGLLNHKCATLAEVLGEAGYATFMTGKWHLGLSERKYYPLQRGFEKFYGIAKGAGPYFNPTLDSGLINGNELNTQPVSTTDRTYYATDAFTDYAISYLAEEKMSANRPFFLYLAYNAPHWPLHAHEEEIAKYVGKYRQGWDRLRGERLQRQRKSGLIQADWELSERSAMAWETLSEQQKVDLDLRMAIYAAMVDRMDQNIAKLVTYLKESEQFENTLILFLSDNGASHEGGKLGGSGNPAQREEWNQIPAIEASYGQAWANASNTPFRKSKHFTHEGGIATPLIAHWPKGIKSTGEWYRARAYTPDIAATLYEIAGASYPATLHGHTLPPLVGVSLAPAFAGKAITRREPIFLEHDGNATVISGKMKLVGSEVAQATGVKEAKWELYDLAKDRTELHDLAESRPELVKELSAQWTAWAEANQVYPKPLRKGSQKPKAKKKTN